MNVLFLIIGRTGNIKRIMYDPILGLSKYCNINIYGPSANLLFGNKISPLAYDRYKFSIDDVIAELKPDILVLPEQVIASEFFDDYSHLKIPKVILEIDYYAVKDKDWYKRNKIDLMVMAHPYTPDTLPVTSVWWPFGVTEDQFLVDSVEDNRIEKVVFVGGGRYSRNKYYSTRQKAMRLLESYNLIDTLGEVGYDNYPKILKEYKCALSCSFPSLYFPPIKTFEIMASGTVLLTTDFPTKETLFGKEKVFYTYKEDCSDLLDVVEEIIDSKEAISVANNAVRCIKENHLHSHRHLELYNILTAVVQNTEVEKKWII